MAKILTGSESDIALAGTLLREGEIVAVPTETVYGLAANALLEQSVRAIFAAKNRPFIDPLIVHVASVSAAKDFADISHPFVKKLADAFWPGPMTLVLPKTSRIPDVVTAGEKTVAIRVPAHPLMRKILAAAGVPIAAPSANPFGYVSPTTAQHVQDSLGEKIGWIVDGGVCDCGVESTIVLVADLPRILRPGVITREQIEAVLGVPVASAKGHLEKIADGEKCVSTAEKIGAQLAPGMLKKHYSPRVPVFLFENGTFPQRENFPNAVSPNSRVAVVFQKESSFLESLPVASLLGANPKNVEFFALSKNGDQREVARNIFSTLRKIDSGNFNAVFIEKSLNAGVGIAVNDRISRAAAKRE